MMWAVERKLRGTGLGDQLARILREERELPQGRAGRHCREGEQVDTPLRELRQDTVGRAKLVTNIGVVVVDGTDRESHRTSRADHGRRACVRPPDSLPSPL